MLSADSRQPRPRVTPRPCAAGSAVGARWGALAAPPAGSEGRPAGSRCAETWRESAPSSPELRTRECRLPSATKGPSPHTRGTWSCKVTGKRRASAGGPPAATTGPHWRPDTATPLRPPCALLRVRRSRDTGSLLDTGHGSRWGHTALIERPDFQIPSPKGQGRKKKGKRTTQNQAAHIT